MDNVTVIATDYITSLGSSTPHLFAVKSTETPFSGIAYHHRLVVSSCLFFIIILGLFGNSLVVVAVAVSKKLQTTTNILVVNLTVADLFTCLSLPFMVVGLLAQGEEYPLPEIVCSIASGLNTICLGVSVMTLAAIAFIRWYVISKSIRGHRGLHTPRKIGMAIIGIWMLGITITALPVSLGIGELGYSRYYMLCSVTDTNPFRFYYVLLQAAAIFVVLVITGVFYVLIMIHVLRQTRQFQKKFADDSRSTGPKAPSSQANADSRAMQTAFMKREYEITKNLFTVVCIFMVCLVPSIVNFIIPGTSVLTLYGAMVLAANSSINPIIYALKHPNFQEAFKKVICCRTVDSRNPGSSKPRTTATNTATNRL
ncbi:rhodopsin, GQ-coupled-like [Lytechinus pictus]|uniref:rhodopsin, GQ-coupled-like n=1 Tax=Lytechinus pictus TaxID=7653 RepID=UPI0030B9C0D3